MEGLLSGNLLSKANVFGGSVGSNMKPIQRVSSTFTHLGPTTLNLTIPAVNMTKTIVTVSRQSYAYGERSCIKAKLTSPTNIEVSRVSNENANPFVISVLEFINVKSLQRADYTLSVTGPVEIAVSPIDPSKSILFISHSHTSGLNSDESEVIQADILTASTIGLHIQLAIANVHWQLIEFF